MSYINPQQLISLAIFIILLSYIFLFIGILIVIIREYHRESDRRVSWAKANNQLFKNLRKRLSLLFIFLSFYTLVDELLKEGYVFKPSDLFTPEITHEKLFLVFLLLGLIIGKPGPKH